MPEVTTITLPDELEALANDANRGRMIGKYEGDILRAAAGRLRELGAENIRLRAENLETTKALGSMLGAARRAAYFGGTVLDDANGCLGNRGAV